MENYPLQWPLGYTRTPSYKRQRSNFKQTMDGAQRFLRDELRRLGAKDLIVSTNIPIRQDGGMYAAYMGKKLEDPGVAIFFKWNKKEVTMCCDQYNTVWENTYALGKGIEAIRGMERWGVSDFIERAFTGFTAIEAPKEVKPLEWYDILECRPDSTEEVIKANYRRLCKDWHPDIAGPAGEQKIRAINNAYELAKALKGFN